MAQMRTSVEVRNQVLELNRQEVGIKKIAKALRISKNTVRKILRDAADDKSKAKEVPSWARSVNWESVHESVGRGVPVNILHREHVDAKEVSYLRFWRYYKSLHPASVPVSMVLNHNPRLRLCVSLSFAIGLFEFCDTIFDSALSFF